MKSILRNLIADTEDAETLELESILPLDDPTASKTEETKWMA